MHLQAIAPFSIHIGTSNLPVTLDDNKGKYKTHGGNSGLSLCHPQVCTRLYSVYCAVRTRLHNAIIRSPFLTEHGGSR